VTAALYAADLPNKDAVREAVKASIFALRRLKVAFTLLNTYDNAIRLYRTLTGFAGDEKLTSFIKELLPIYG
jgi:hypothetical protein